MLLTKKTVYSFNQSGITDHPQISAVRRALLEEMIQQGRTDGWCYDLGNDTYERHFLDQAAAEHYINTMNPWVDQWFGSDCYTVTVSDIT